MTNATYKRLQPKPDRVMFQRPYFHVHRRLCKGWVFGDRCVYQYELRINKGCVVLESYDFYGNAKDRCKRLSIAMQGPCVLGRRTG